MQMYQLTDWPKPACCEGVTDIVRQAGAGGHMTADLAFCIYATGPRTGVHTFVAQTSLVGGTV